MLVNRLSGLATGLIIRKTRQRPPGYIPSSALMLLLIGLGTIIYLAPGFSKAPWGEKTVLVVDNIKAGEGLVKVEEHEIYLAVEALREHLDPHFFWDEQEKTAVITTANRVVHMYSEELTAEINLQPVELQFPLREEEENLYLPLLFLSDFYSIKVRYYPESDTVVIDQAETGAYLAEVSSSATRLREGPGLHHPTLALLQPGDLIRLEYTYAGWCAVRSAGGMIGYLPASRLTVLGAYPSPGLPSDTGKRKDKIIPGHPLVITWEFRRPDVSTIGKMAPLQVISPKWFHLADGAGNLRNTADPAYGRWARERGYQIWALVDNSFNPQITGEMLSSSSARKKVIDQLLIYARLYELDGLNLDFENFHYTYGDLFTQFVRELAPLCDEAGLVLSVDVTMISGEPYWSKGYDRKALGEAADYIILMAYDEHWASCPYPGSVASLPWVEHGLQRVLQEVPAEKLVLGVPFYTRLWQIENTAGGDRSKSSRSLTMHTAEALLKGKDTETWWDDQAGQNVVRYEEGGSVYQLWLEDADSMEQRLALVNRYRLAGVASWARGFEHPEIWELIEAVLSEYGKD